MTGRLYMKKTCFAKLQNVEHFELMSKIRDLLKAYNPTKLDIIEEFIVLEMELENEEIMIRRMDHALAESKKNEFARQCIIARRASEYAWRIIRNKIQSAISMRGSEKYRDFILDINLIFDSFKYNLLTEKESSDKTEKSKVNWWRWKL